MPCNLYTIDVDQENRNCYSCGGFGYMARNCRNRKTGGRIEKGRKLEYRNGNNKQRRMIEGANEQNSNLNGKQSLIVFD